MFEYGRWQNTIDGIKKGTLQKITSCYNIRGNSAQLYPLC